MQLQKNSLPPAFSTTTAKSELRQRSRSWPVRPGKLQPKFICNAGFSGEFSDFPFNGNPDTAFLHNDPITWCSTLTLHRKPRSHPDVLDKLDVLLRCIKFMPCTGPLFTSQAPFFPVFLIGMVAYRDEDRQVARDWFDTVISGASCRSVSCPTKSFVQLPQLPC